MTDSIFRNFSVSIKPEVIRKEYDGRMRTVVQTQIDLTDIKTGKVWSKLTDKRVTLSSLETVILNQFPESQSASEIQSARHFSMVTLAKDCSSDNVAVCLHTALRKLCDSTASGYWWNRIHALPSGVMGQVWEATGKALSEVGRTAQLKTYAQATHDAWTQTFERLEYAAAMWSSRKRVYGGAEGDVLSAKDAKKFEAQFEEMTSKAFDAYYVAVKMAKLAVDYLDEDDWAGMLGYIIEYQTEDKTPSAEKVLG